MNNCVFTPSPADVLLVTMPFAEVERPSLALGILTAILRKEGINVNSLYANLIFLSYIDSKDYYLVKMNSPENSLPEWIFSELAFPDDKCDIDGYINIFIQKSNFLNRLDHEFLFKKFIEIKKNANKFLNELASDIIKAGPRIVGCTSTFQQHVPSLALLRILREKAPEIITIMGGANCETVMGATTHKNFKYVDYVVSGEADELIGPLVKLILDKGRDIPLNNVPYGIFAPCHRTKGYPRQSKNDDQYPRATTASLNSIPIPDYDDYFNALRSISKQNIMIMPCLPIESSRGCFWGRCHFCGLNGKANGQRIKSVNHVIEEINNLSYRYGVDRIEVVDNVLHPKHVPELFEELINQGSRYKIFYEVRTYLKKKDIEIMSRAGVNWIQPGIESLHSKILRLMNKGMEVWQNIQVLKWCREYGIRAVWKIMFGFPEEKDIWYNEMADLMPLLFHLEPPDAINKVRFDRYSEYHKYSGQYNLALSPYKLFGFTYPLSIEEQHNLTYFFEDINNAKREENPVISCLIGINSMNGLENIRERVSEWQKHFWGKDNEMPLLLIVKRHPLVNIVDTRPIALSSFFELNELQSAIYLACDEAKRVEKLREDFKKDNIAYNTFDKALEYLVNQKLLLNIENHCLSLAIDSSYLPFSRPMDCPLGFSYQDNKMDPNKVNTFISAIYEYRKEFFKDKH